MEDLAHLNSKYKILHEQREMFFKNAEKRKKKNTEIIQNLQNENIRYKKMRDELQTNKQVQGEQFSKTAGNLG